MEDEKVGRVWGKERREGRYKKQPRDARERKRKAGTGK
jgi:hypothetical protein